MALPSPEFRLNGGAPGVKASVSAGGLVTCTLDDTTGVTYVEWSIITTDETTAPGDYVLSTTGGAVPGAHTMTFNAGAAATSGIIRAQINHGINTLTGNAASESASDVTIATAKWYVPTGGAGFEMLADGEEDESNATHGKTGEWNQAARAMGGGGAGAFTYIELGSGTKASLGLVRMSRNFVALACKTAASTNHAILTEDNADGFQWGDSTLTAQWITDVKTGGAWYLRVNGATIATINASGIGLASGTTYAVNGVGHATAATASSLAFRGASSEAAFGYLYASGSVPTVGFIRGASGFVVIATLTAAGSFDNVGFSDDGADAWKVGNDTRSAGVRLAAKTGGSVTVEINNAVEVTLDATGINLASGNTYQVNGVAHTASSTASSLMFRDAAGRSSVVDPSADADIATKGYVDGADRDSNTEPTVIVASDRYVYVDGTVVNNVTLPTSVTFSGINLTLVNTSDTGGDDITVTADGVEVIGVGGSTAILLLPGYSMTLRGRASSWVIVSTGTI